MTKKITLFGMMLLLSVVSVFASGIQLPKVDVARQQKMAAEVNTDLMMRPRGSVNSPFAKTPLLKMQKPTQAFDVMREAEVPTSNIYGLQVFNTDDIYDSWWKLDVATAKSTVQWSNDLLAEYNYNAGFVRKGIVYAITVETGYILKYDLATGEYINYISLYSTDYSKYILHAAYDEKNDIVYVYTYDESGDGLMFQKYDPDTNTFTHIKTELGVGTLADDPIITMGYNPIDGFIYAVTLYGEKWIRIDTENGEYEELNSIAFSPAYFTQAMVYSPNDFGFVYVGIDLNEETYVMVVEPETGAIKSKTLSVKEEEYAFMYCSDQAVVNNAPAMPEIKELTFEGAATSGKAIVVAPTVTFDGSAITESLEMVVKIDDVTIDTRTVTAGQEVEIALNNVANGKHTFSVVCNTVSGVEGAIATREFFVGYDTPAAPQNVVLTETLLTWDAVTAGVNGGMLESGVTYNVYIDGVKQNDAPIEGTSFEVNIATDVMTKIQAAVEAVSGSKVSEKAYSNILAVGAYQLPLELVCDKDFVNSLTIVDANDDGVKWGWCSDHNAFEYNYSPYLNADDWAILHKTTFPQSRQLYRIDLDVRSGYAKYPEKFEIGLSKTGKIEDMIIVVPETIVASESIITLGGEFKLEEAGDYFIGIHVFSDADQYYLRVNKINVTMSEAPNSVPEACTEVTATGADYGELMATVEMTMPTINLNGDALDPESDVTVKVYSNVGEGSATAKPGERATATVPTEQGINYLRLVSENEFGVGAETSVSVFTGVDVPKPAELTSLEISDDNRSMTFSWETSIDGVNGGFVDPAYTKYLLLIYYEVQDYWFTLAADYDGTQYTYTLPEGSKLQSVNIAIQSINAAGRQEEGPIVTASLGTPYSIPMEEIFEDFSVIYYPLTIERPSEEYSGSWTISNPEAYVSGSYKAEGSSLVAFSNGEDECYSQLALPKFSPNGYEGVLLSLDAYLYDNMADAVVFVRGSKNEALPVGTITKGEDEEGWKTFEFLLPEEVCEWGWAEIVIRAEFTKADQYFLIGRYALTPWSGIGEMTTSDAVIYGADDAIIVKNAPKGSTFEVFTIDGRMLLNRRIEDDNFEVSVNKGIYVARCGNKTAKVIVK